MRRQRPGSVERKVIIITIIILIIISLLSQQYVLGPGGDRGQVLSAAARLRQGEHRQPRADGQAAHGESEARPGRAHQVRNKSLKVQTPNPKLKRYVKH